MKFYPKGNICEIFSCWQLLIAFNFHQLFSAVISFQFNCIGYLSVSSIVFSYWQLIWRKLDWNFYVHTKVDTCAKSQLSRLIFIFINCYQLLSATDSCWQLMTVDMNKIWLEQAGAELSQARLSLDQIMLCQIQLS